AKVIPSRIVRNHEKPALQNQACLTPIKTRRKAMYVVGTYVAYLTISIALTIWVARTLVKNGRIFLVDSFLGNESLADSVNHLLAVGFYLVNVGYVALALKYGEKPLDLAQAIEALSTKVGLVLLVLGAMHFFNLYVFSRLRRRALGRSQRARALPEQFVERVQAWTHGCDVQPRNRSAPAGWGRSGPRRRRCLSRPASAGPSRRVRPVGRNRTMERLYVLYDARC